MAMNVSRCYVVLASLVAICAADQFAWEGNYTDPIYGGYLYVCVSEVGGVYYGQGVFSNVGYMRGTIGADMMWSGQYYLAGEAATRGSFSLMLYDGAMEYNGTFMQQPNMMYSIAGMQLSSVTPADVECFRTSDALLQTTASYTWTGAYGNDAEKSYIASNSDGNTQTYYIDVGNNNYITGVSYGPYFNKKQISTLTYYEDGASGGIELWVARNANEFYLLYWSSVQRVSDINWSERAGSQFIQARDTSSKYTEDMAYGSACKAQWTYTTEESCEESKKSCDEDVNDALLLATLILAAACCGLLIVILGMFCRARQTSLPNIGGDVKNELHGKL